MTTWSDDTFVNINSGGDYATCGEFGSDSWTSASPAGIKENFTFGSVCSVRLAAATGALQYAKINVPALNSFWILKLRCSSTADPDNPRKNGYTVRYEAPYILFHSNDSTQVSFIDTGAGLPSTAGNVEIRVDAAHLVTVYLNGTSAGSFNFSGTPSTGSYQGFGSKNSCVVTYAEGGDIGGSATVPDQVATPTLSVISATEIDIGWNAPGNGGSPITGYKIERAPDSAGSPGTWATLVANTGTPSPRFYADHAVTVGQHWWYRVSAINSVGTGTASTAADAVAADPPPPAFSDDFSAGLRMWTVARWRSQLSQGGGHGYVVSSSDDDGHYDGVPGTHTTPTGVGLLPPYDIFVGTGNHLFVGGGSQNYGDTFLRCAQKMDLTGSGPWKIRLGFIPNPNGTDPGGYGLMGWTTLYLTDEPQPSPSMEGENSHGPVPKYGFSVRFDYAMLSPDGIAPKVPCPQAFYYNNFVENDVGNDLPHLINDISTTTPVDVVVTFTRTNILITANGQAWFSKTWTLPTALTSAWVYLGAHNHATRKYPPHPDSRSAVFTYFNFDGPVITPQFSCAVADHLDVNDGTGEEQAVAGVNVGWLSPTGPLTIPNVPANVSAARLLMTTHWSAPNDPNNLFVRYSLNGNTAHDVQTDYQASSYNYAHHVAINPAELIIGDNIINISLIGQTSGFAPCVGNISLLIEAFTPGKIAVGSTILSRLAVGTTDIQRLALGTTEIWRAPLPPRVPTAPTLITTTKPANGQLASRWSQPVDNGSALTDFTVQYRVAPAGTYTTFSHTPSTARTITITGLTTGTAYDVRVAAVNGIGTSAFSNVMRATA